MDYNVYLCVSRIVGVIVDDVRRWGEENKTQKKKKEQQELLLLNNHQSDRWYRKKVEGDTKAMALLGVAVLLLNI